MATSCVCKLDYVWGHCGTEAQRDAPRRPISIRAMIKLGILTCRIAGPGSEVARLCRYSGSWNQPSTIIIETSITKLLK